MLGLDRRLEVDSVHQKKSVPAAVWHRYVHLGLESIVQNPVHLFVFPQISPFLFHGALLPKVCGIFRVKALLEKLVCIFRFWIFLLPSSLANSKSCTSEYCVHCPTAASLAALKLIPRHEPGSFATLKAAQFSIQAAKLLAFSVEITLPM